MTENWAVIPVKGFTESKSRLADFLGDKRSMLVEALLQDVLSSVSQSLVFDKVFLVSPDENISRLANGRRINFLRQTGLGLNRAVEQASRVAGRQNASSSTVILGDIPLAEPRDYTEIFEIGATGRKLVMVPSLKGGTNVMLNSPPGVVRPSYGRWSYSKHLRQAQLAGVSAYSLSNPRVSFDVDTPADLLELRRRDPRMRMLSTRALEDVELNPRSLHVHS